MNDKIYDINFTSLNLGIHEFEYEIEDKFFEGVEYSEIEGGSIRAIVELEKKETMLVVRFSIKGNVKKPCDLCTTMVTIPIENNDQVIFKFSEKAIDEANEIIGLKDSEYLINVGHHIYEFIGLAVPARCVHEEGKCDPDVLQALERVLLTEMPHDPEDDDDDDSDDDQDIDPRWSQLNDLK